MALDSSSTFDDAYAQINNSHAWAGNPAKAADWLEAARWLMVNRPNFSMRQNAQIGWTNLEKEIARAHPYVEGTSPTAQRASFVKGRSRYV